MNVHDPVEDCVTGLRGDPYNID